MSKQDILFVINPISGGNKKNSNLSDEIFKILPEEEFNPIIINTERPLHATEIVKSYLEKGIKEIVAVGGDGTINEVACQLINTDVVLNVISRGSGNGLARHLGIYNDTQTCLKRIVSGKVIEIDTCTINQIPFLCTAGLGFDAHGAEQFGRLKGRGLKNYIRVGLTSYFKYKPVDIEFKDKTYKVFSISFGNASQFGNNAYVTPKADISDGLIDCCIVKEHSKLAVMKLTWQLFNKSITNSKHVEYFQEKSFSLKTKSPALIHFDGEPKLLNTSEIRLEIKEKSLKIKI